MSAIDSRHSLETGSIALAPVCCPCRKLSSWRTGANRVMLLADGSAAQIALWRAHWAVAVHRTTWSGDPGSSPPDQRVEAQIAEQTGIEQRRSLVVRFAISAGTDNTWRTDSDSAGHTEEWINVKPTHWRVWPSSVKTT